jgi:hypothetical protein
LDGSHRANKQPVIVKRRKEADAMRMTSERGGDSRSEIVPDG